MQTPDLTRAQLLAIAKAAIAVAVAFGVPLRPAQQVALLALAGGLAVVLMTADAMIRRARAQHLAGPLADQQAAATIAAATATTWKHRMSHAIVDEAQREAAAQRENEAAQMPDGNDPAAPS